MADSNNDDEGYLDINELVARTGLSKATIWRLKRAGKIPFFQPGGKRGRVKFPANAIEVAGTDVEPTSPATDEPSSDRVPGPRPKWQSSGRND